MYCTFGPLGSRQHFGAAICGPFLVVQYFSGTSLSFQWLKVSFFMTLMSRSGKTNGSNCLARSFEHSHNSPENENSTMLGYCIIKNPHKNLRLQLLGSSLQVISPSRIRILYFPFGSLLINSGRQLSPCVAWAHFKHCL